MWLVAGACLVVGRAVRAADRFVSETGADAANDCLLATAPCRSVSHAVGQAVSGDTVNVTTGVYRDNVRIEAAERRRLRHRSRRVRAIGDAWRPRLFLSQRPFRPAPS
jgi:hypothetical protein